MSAQRTIAEQIREHLFLLVWLVAAVAAKYAVTPKSADPIEPATAETTVTDAETVQLAGR